MAVLINQKLLKSCIEKFNFPENEKRQRINDIITAWQTAFKDHDLSKAKETSLQGKFFSKFFCEILGYTMQDDGNEVWTLKQEAKTEVDGKEADGSLGFYGKNSENTRCVIELKDAQCNLDSKQCKRENKQTPVEQAFQYLYKFADCDWVIVSNFRYTRLYHKSKGQTAYEEFDILTLNEEKEFKRFYYCLCKENLLNENACSQMDLLIKQSGEADIDITKEFYSEFKQTRKILFNHIIENNPNFDKKLLLEKTQKLLDRFIFIFFCEDTAGLLPHNTVENIYKMAQNSFSMSECRIWEQFRGLFIAIDKGNKNVNPPINAYNGGLFAYDEILDKLIIKDEMFKYIKELARYDFESDLNVNILGHIFEQSLSDLEQIKNEIDGIQEDKKNTKRKKDGIFYTPEYITHYIVEETIGRYLEENPDKLEAIKILDPACGSGAFLNQAHSFLLKQRQIRVEEKINAEKSTKKGGTEFLQTDLFKHTNKLDHDRSILLNNLFGVDLNKESVEITKLALWLKTANSKCKLNNLDENIKCGNSLIDDETIAGNKAFKWENEYKDIMQNGGFDVIIGNPPYVNISNIKEEQERKYLQQNYTDSAIKRFDLYTLFIDLSLSLLKNGGYLSFIIPYPFLSQDYAEVLRKKILEKYSIIEIINLQQVKVFDDAEVKSIIIIIKKDNSVKNCNIANIISAEDFNCQLNFDEISCENWKQTENYQFRLDFTIKNKVLINKIKDNNITYGDIFYVSKGASLHSEKLGKKGSDYIFESLTDNNKKPFLQGKDCIDRYAITKTKGLLYKKDEHYRPMFVELFENNEKLVIYKVTGDKGLIVCYDNKGHYTNDSLYLAVPYKFLQNVKLPKNKITQAKIEYSKNISIKYALAIINSNLMNYYFKNVFGYGLNVYPDDIKRLPIPNATEEQQISLSQKADRMIELNKSLKEETQKAIELIELEYKPKKITQNLTSFYTLGLNPFIEELEKQGVTLSLTQKEDLISWYKTKSELLNKIKLEMDTLDQQIDQEVYKLYNLTPEEIQIIEGGGK